MDDVDPDEEIERWIVDNVHPEKAKQLAHLIGKVVRKQVATIINQSDDNNRLLARSVAAIPVPAVDSFITVNEPAAKKQKVAKNDLPDRHSINTLDGAREKVEMMVTLWKGKPTWSATRLTPGAKSFSIKFLTPAMNCLDKHFGGVIDLFLEKYPNFKHTTFPTKCCNGKGTNCGVAK
jgi:hypothetical protein